MWKQNTKKQKKKNFKNTKGTKNDNDDNNDEAIQKRSKNCVDDAQTEEEIKRVKVKNSGSFNPIIEI